MYPRVACNRHAKSSLFLARFYLCFFFSFFRPDLIITLGVAHYCPGSRVGVQRRTSGGITTAQAVTSLKPFSAGRPFACSLVVPGVICFGLLPFIARRGSWKTFHKCFRRLRTLWPVDAREEKRKIKRNTRSQSHGYLNNACLSRQASRLIARPAGSV